MPPVRVYSWYGYIGAPFPRGVGYSRGLDVLGEKLAALPGVTVAPTHANWLSQSKVAADARAHPSARKVCIGHSMGVYAITRMAARARDIVWDLMIAFEPAPGYTSLGAFTCPPLHRNVRRAICFRSTNWLNPLGHGWLRAAPDFEGDITTIGLDVLHHRIAGDPGAHDVCVKAVRALAMQGDARHQIKVRTLAAYP
jgi:pimeloyl-ACP methyl ester carboxylesterase